VTSYTEITEREINEREASRLRRLSQAYSRLVAKLDAAEEAQPNGLYQHSDYWPESYRDAWELFINAASSTKVFRDSARVIVDAYSKEKGD